MRHGHKVHGLPAKAEQSFVALHSTHSSAKSAQSRSFCREYLVSRCGYFLNATSCDRNPEARTVNASKVQGLC